MGEGSTEHTQLGPRGGSSATQNCFPSLGTHGCKLQAVRETWSGLAPPGRRTLARSSVAWRTALFSAMGRVAERWGRATAGREGQTSDLARKDLSSSLRCAGKGLQWEPSPRTQVDSRGRREDSRGKDTQRDQRPLSLGPGGVWVSAERERWSGIQLTVLGGDSMIQNTIFLAHRGPCPGQGAENLPPLFSLPYGIPVNTRTEDSATVPSTPHGPCSGL